mgnify:CR=1 FL=1
MSSTQDVNGKESSKRKQGARFLTATLLLCISYFILLTVAWFIGRPLFEFPVQLVAILGSVGTTLVGVTVFEKPKL